MTDLEEVVGPGSGGGARAPHLVYIAWGYPPARGSGVYRAVATSNAFAAAGWRVTVVTADKESFAKYTASDTKLEGLIDPRVSVVRVPYTRPYLENDVRDWSRIRMELPLVWGMVSSALDEVDFPEKKYARWFRPVVKTVRAIHRTNPVDLVIGTANPQVDAAAAAALHPEVPYIVDYRDAWVLDVFTGERLHSKHSRQAKWERRLFEGAQEIWFVNEPIRDWHATEYPQVREKMWVVPNGSDLASTPAGQPRERRGGPVTFVYLGTITPNVPIAEFGEGWQLARAQIPDAEVHLFGHLGFFEKVKSEEQVLVDRLIAGGGVQFHGAVSKTEVDRAYAGADVLLLMIGGGRYVTSGKLYEYIATGLPIVSVHAPESAASTVLRDYPLWFPSKSLQPGDVADALRAAHRQVVEPDPECWQRAAAAAGGTKRAAILAPHLARLAEVVGNK